MKLSEIIIRRQIRRILQEAVPTSTAVAGTFGYAANPRGGAKGSFERKIVLGVLGAIGARILYGILKGDTTPEKEAKLNMKAVICGDSQGKGYLGNEVGKILSSQGYKVSNVSVNGAGPDAVLDQVKAHAKNALLVVAIFGGNTSSATKSADGVVKMYEHCEQQGTAFMAIGPPPVTEITDPGEITKRGGNKNHWLELSPSDIHSQSKRKEISDAMEAATSSSGEQINVYGVASNWRPKEEGGKYPDQPDGLHCQNGAAEVAKAAMDSLGIDNVTAQLRKEIETKSGVSFDPSVVGKASHPSASTPNDFDIERYKRGIAKVESNSGYGAESKSSSAKGKYQFLASLHTLNLLEFMKQDPKYSSLASKYARATNAGYKQGDSTSVGLWKEFLKNPDLQEDFMSWIVPTKFAPIARPYYDQSRNAPNDVLSNFDYAQINALYHLNGVDGPKEVRSSGLESRPDENNLTYGEYLSTFNKGYEYDK